VNNYKTDIVVIGEGAAGLRAAIEASRKGLDVLVISKPGSATSMAGGGHAAVFEEYKTDSYENHFWDTIKGGYGVNNHCLVRVLANEASSQIMMLDKMGVEFLKVSSQYKQFRPGGHNIHRSCRCVGGTAQQLVTLMKNRAKELGVRFLRGVDILEVIVKEQSARGVWGYYIKNGAQVVVESKGVLLATGGAGSLFSRTTNPPSSNGMGYALAYEAGASLVDMEFIQFLPIALLEPSFLSGKTANDTIRGEGAQLLNNCRERFMQEYDPERMEYTSRDVAARAIYTEIIEGRGTELGGVFLDARMIPAEVLEKGFEVYRALKKHGFDMSQELIQVAPAAHFTCGGVQIDENGNTSIQGLFAAGEVTGGVHGANRLGGNALSEAQVFGARAGETAAHYVLKTKAMKLDPDIHINSDKSNFKTFEALKQVVKARIGEVMWQSVGIIRNGDKMQAALKEIGDLREEVRQMEKKIGFPAKKLKLILTTAELITVASLYREESRGSHYRTDFPKRDDNRWCGNIILKKDGERTSVGFSLVEPK